MIGKHDFYAIYLAIFFIFHSTLTSFSLLISVNETNTDFHQTSLTCLHENGKFSENHEELKQCRVQSKNGCSRHVVDNLFDIIDIEKLHEIGLTVKMTLSLLTLIIVL